MISECPSCGKKLSKKSKTCPRCGYAFSVTELEDRKILLTRRKSKMMGWVTFIVIFIGIALMALGIFLLILFFPFNLNSFDTPFFLLVGGPIFFGLGLVIFISGIISSIKIRKNNKNKYPCLLLEDDGSLEAILYNESRCFFTKDKVIGFKCNFFTDYMLVLIYKAKNGSKKKLTLGYSQDLQSCKEELKKLK